MQCPQCGRTYPAGEKVCTDCWEPLVDPEETELTEKTEPVGVPDDPDPEAAPEARESEESGAEPGETANPEETPEETAAEPEDAGEENPEPVIEPEAVKPPKKQVSRLAVVFGVIAGLLLVAVVCLTIVLTTVSKTGSMPSIASLFHRSSFRPQAVAMTVQDDTGATVAEITNEQLSYYYWGEYFYFSQSYGFSFDPSKELSEQMYDDTTTWQDYFLESARTSIAQIECLKAQAAAEGFTMTPEYQEQYDNTIGSLAEYAASAGFADKDGNGDIEAYVRESYGKDATVEGFEAYLYDSYFASAYSDHLYESLSVTDEEAEAYFDENAEMYASYGIEKADTPDVNVRHILLQPEDTELGEDATEEETEKAQEAVMKAAKEEAERIYKEWQDGEATEESFAELANTYSTDPGSNTNGGLYENVYPGQMVDSFNDWCFDPDRKVGDTGIVETSYGYHIMYFSGYTDIYYWKEAAMSDAKYERYSGMMDELTGKYTVTDTEKLALETPDAVKDIQQQYAQDSAAEAAEPAAPAGSSAG